MSSIEIDVPAIKIIRKCITIYSEILVHAALLRTGVIGSDVPWLECPACNALTWVITVTE